MNSCIYCCKMFFVALLILCICCGCSFDTETPESSNSTKNEEVSLVVAKAIVEKEIPLEPDEYFVEFQRMDTIEGREYYYFLVYTLGSQPIEGDQGPFYQQFTYAWAYVDAQTGKLYEMSPGGLELVPWERKTQGDGSHG